MNMVNSRRHLQAKKRMMGYVHVTGFGNPKLFVIICNRNQFLTKIKNQVLTEMFTIHCVHSNLPVYLFQKENLPKNDANCQKEYW